MDYAHASPECLVVFLRFFGSQPQTQENAMVAEFNVPVELSDAELDAVAAGQGGIAGQAGLVNVGVFVQDTLNNVDVDILNHNNVAVGAGVAVAVLGAAGAVGRGVAGNFT